MEQNHAYKTFMIDNILSKNFNDQHWDYISKISPHIFLKIQKSIKNQLLQNKNLYQKYFQKFYTNHKTLAQWWMLAIQKKAKISSYVFRDLVSKDLQYYNQKISQIFDNKFRKVKSSQVSQVYEKTKNMKQEVYKDFFDNLLVRNKIQNTDKPLNLKLYGKKLPNKEEDEQMDSHDFYIKTFNACNGWNYIFYNYEKHMKGLSEKTKYNQKIRNRQHMYNISCRQKNQMNLLSFQHQNVNQGFCKVLPFKGVLKNDCQNSYSHLRRMSNQDVKKIVLVNHQGKPITYRVNKTKKLRT